MGVTDEIGLLGTGGVGDPEHGGGRLSGEARR